MVDARLPLAVDACAAFDAPEPVAHERAASQFFPLGGAVESRVNLDVMGHFNSRIIRNEFASLRFAA
jgi:hypothetical protein